MVEPKALVEHLLELEADAVAVGGRLDEDVCRERGEAARHRPDMQVVRVDDPGMGGDGAADLVGRRRLGGGEEEDAPRLLQKPVAPPEEEARNELGGKRRTACLTPMP